MIEIETKKQILDQFFKANYQDYIKIIEKISNNRKRHQDLTNEEKLTIIYMNIHKRLNGIPDRFFVDINQFRSLFIQTTQMQLTWTTSDISAYKDNLRLKMDEIDNESYDTIITTNKCNNQALINEYYTDNYDEQLQFIYQTYPSIINDLLDEVTYDIIINDNNITGPALAKKIGISTAAATTILRIFKDKINFTFKNYNYIKNKNNFKYIAELHPDIRLNLVQAINQIEMKYDEEVKITEAYISRKKQNERYNNGQSQIKGGDSPQQYYLGFKAEFNSFNNEYIKIFENNNFINMSECLTWNYDLEVAKLKFKNKEYKTHNYIKL